MTRVNDAVATRRTGASLFGSDPGPTKGEFDGNGKEGGLAREIAGLQRELYGAIQTYAKNVGSVPIAFTETAYPHWFADRNGNGRIEPEELGMANKYPTYTPRLLEAV